MSQGNIFDLHHLVKPVYPAFGLIDNSKESIVLPNATSAEQRYEALPLVNDEDVIMHAGRVSYEESSYVTLSPARPFHANIFARAGRHIPDHTRLEMDMKDLLTRPGETELYVALYRPRSADQKGGDSKTWIRVFRDSKLYHGNDKYGGWTARSTYNMTEKAFTSLLKGKNSASWARNITHLITGKHDRAVRNVAATVRAQGDLREVFSGWLPPRQPDMSKATTLVTKVIDLAALENPKTDLCAICRWEFSEMECPILQIIECKHIYCRDCFQMDTTANGIKARCPLCRHELFDPAKLGHIPFGLNAQGQYEFDDRFTAWENHERSLADLDVHPAFADSTTTMEVSQDLLSTAWEYIVRHAKNEPTNSTPASLNPANWGEFDKVQAAMEEAFTRLAIKQTTPEALDCFLNSIAQKALFKALEFSQISTIIPHEEMKHLAISVFGGNRFRFRHGFAQFVDRTISRTVNFVKLRTCQCELAQGSHLHGDCRLYYNNGSLTEGKIDTPSTSKPKLSNKAQKKAKGKGR